MLLRRPAPASRPRTGSRWPAVSLYDRLHDGVLKLRPHLTDWSLDHHDRHHVLFGIDPEVRAVCPAPSEAAVGDAMISRNSVLHNADAQAKAFAGRAPGKSRRNVHGAHQLHRPRA